MEGENQHVADVQWVWAGTSRFGYFPPPEVVSYLISPTGSSLEGESICGLIRDDDAIGGGGEPHVPCLCNL